MIRELWLGWVKRLAYDNGVGDDLRHQINVLSRWNEELIANNKQLLKTIDEMAGIAAEDGKVIADLRDQLKIAQDTIMSKEDIIDAKDKIVDDIVELVEKYQVTT